MASKLPARITKLKEEKNAIILAHNYQLDEVQAIADYTGDSLGLSQKAAQTEAEVIVFCGVDFMAESAAILSPDKTVLLPAYNAGCPMAEMITVEELQNKKSQHPEAAVVCYVNSSAAIKAESDICCTSSNAVEIVESIASEKIIFVPDKNLGNYVASQTDKEIICWDGYCPTHHRVTAKDVDKVKEAQPQAPVVVHPECRPEVVKTADYVGSTAQILEFASKSNAETIIIGTEQGLFYRLNQANSAQKFYLLNQGLICQNMKLTSLIDIAEALENLQHQITVPEETRIKAQSTLDKMLELSN
ncbi:quinolinate synthase NadA [Sporohalobacter salinus]|uniref:quinolinate synthase NadA n=1 Tax=Sporohalobacter salinus TaxID=1494606 RepID=UPI0019601DFE|nr:quinolinate synthase NadA [Sporohalobacter salinus]MBM7624967.1 quinolinate synthase [Sporohalobacter salinus]